MPDSNLVPPIGSNGDTEPIQGAIACVVFRSRKQIEFWTWVINIKLIHFNNSLNNFIKFLIWNWIIFDKIFSNPQLL